MNNEQKAKARSESIRWASDLMALEDGFVVLDLETTGLPGKGKRVAFCQVGIVDSDGQGLLSTLVNPGIPIEPGASKVTGIYDETVKDAPVFAGVAPTINGILTGRHVVIYNKSFDWPVLQAVFKHHSNPTPAVLSVGCAMLSYADFHGAWTSYRKSFKWQKLTVACQQMGITVEGEAHDATVDCLMTLELIKAMAGSVTVTQPPLLEVEEPPYNPYHYDQMKSIKRKKR